MEKSNNELKKLILEKGTGDTEENQRIYNKFFKDWQRNHKYIYRKFRINFNMKILDIGCGYGYNLIHFSENSVGIEASFRMAEFASKLGLNVLSINVEDDLSAIGQKFNLIWCTDFLVHMISPYKFLYDCRKLLEDNGRLVIQIPLMSIFNMHRSSCHFYAFNKKSLLYLLEMAGYDIIQISGAIRRKPKWFNFIFDPLLRRWGGNIWVLARKKKDAAIDFGKVYPPKWFKL